MYPVLGGDQCSSPGSPGCAAVQEVSSDNSRPDGLFLVVNGSFSCTDWCLISEIC